jgi:hypothetical protein
MTSGPWVVFKNLLQLLCIHEVVKDFLKFNFEAKLPRIMMLIPL